MLTERVAHRVDGGGGGALRPWPDSGFPAPVEAAHAVDEAEVPDAVSKALRAAQGQSWAVDIRRAVGYVPGKDGEPVFRTERHEIAEDAENPNATRTKTVKLDEWKTQEAFAMRAQKNGLRIAAVWYVERNKRFVRDKDSKQRKDGSYAFRAGDVYFKDVVKLDMAMDSFGERYNVTSLLAKLNEE